MCGQTLSCASIWASFFNNIETTSLWPLTAAKCKGVFFWTNCKWLINKEKNSAETPRLKINCLPTWFIPLFSLEKKGGKSPSNSNMPSLISIGARATLGSVFLNSDLFCGQSNWIIQFGGSGKRKGNWAFCSRNLYCHSRSSDFLDHVIFLQFNVIFFQVCVTFYGVVLSFNMQDMFPPEFWTLNFERWILNVSSNYHT